MKTVKFLFKSEFLVFLKKRGVEFYYSFQGPQTVKHLIESFGIPHTEIGDIIVNGNVVGWDHLVIDHDFIEVHPNLYGTEYTHPFNFILDNHLGKLAKYLRLLGFDGIYRNDITDIELSTISAQTNRILLTRDVRLLMRKEITRGYWVRSKIPREQLAEITRKFQLFNKIRPFTRCALCNGALISVDKISIIPHLQALTKEYYDNFRICENCNQIYWQGSHIDRINEIISQVSN